MSISDPNIGFDEFRRMIPPPAIPICYPSESDWQATELELGTKLPVELKRYCAAYGVGWFRGDVRTGQHSERGPLTLQNLVETFVNHVDHHLKFVQEKRER